MDPIMEIYISNIDIHSWFVDVHKWIFVQYIYQNTWKSGKLIRGLGGFSVKIAQVMISFLLEIKKFRSST